MSAVLTATTEEHRRPQPVPWYRTPLDPALFKELHERSDLLGALQTLGYLGTLVATGSLSWYSSIHWPWWVTVALVFVHGTCYAFQINAVHELGHGTVFRTKWLNVAFERLFSFLGWVNFQFFDVSHVRHHQYTLHPPDDLEAVLPYRIPLKWFFQRGFINPHGPAPTGFYGTMKEVFRYAFGQFSTPWELALFPASDPAKRRKPILWAWTLIIGHSIIAAVAIVNHWWMLLVLVTFASFYGGWLQFVCNSTQHIGLQDNVSDFRLCCRTYTLNPVAQFLYWHMNYHTEHHMYAAVPCYKLGRLHRAIKHELPPCPHGIANTWREVAAIQKIQDTNPSYQHIAAIPAQSPR